MINKFTCLAIMLLLSFSSCDLNDTDENGTTNFHLTATIDGVNWAASTEHVGASPDNSGITPLVKIHGDGSGNNEYFYIYFRPLVATDTTISSAGMTGVLEFHRNSQTWVSVNGNLTVHQAGSPTYREYSGTFSGSLFNAADSTTITITNGDYLVQGIF